MIGSIKRTVAYTVGNEHLAGLVAGVTSVSLVQRDLSKKLGVFQGALDTFVTGEGLFNDLFVTAGEVAKQKLRGFGRCLKSVARFAIDTGLGLAAPIALGVAAPALLVGGARQLIRGFKNKDTLAGIQGGRKMVLAGEISALATQIAPRLAGATLSRIAAVAVAPMAVVQIALDTAQGAFQVVRGAQDKDTHQVANGVSDLAMATALSVGLAAGPAAALPIACAALTLKVVNGNSKAREEQERAEGLVSVSVGPQAKIDFSQALDLS